VRLPAGGTVVARARLIRWLRPRWSPQS
jgi:hypothetical protein